MIVTTSVGLTFIRGMAGMASVLPHPQPFSSREKGEKPLSQRERGWG
jgi:hypothetical protein